mgnify:CR=1 FL=1
MSQETAESRLAKTLFIVEANSFEQHALWADHAKDTCFPRIDPRTCKLAHEHVKWEQLNPGGMVTVGTLAKMPVCLSISFARIEGHIVCFWYQCSQVTDGRKAEAWLKSTFAGLYKARATCDAFNFHQCLRAIEDLNKARAV